MAVVAMAVEMTGAKPNWVPLGSLSAMLHFLMWIEKDEARRVPGFRWYVEQWNYGLAYHSPKSSRAPYFLSAGSCTAMAAPKDSDFGRPAQT